MMSIDNLLLCVGPSVQRGSGYSNHRPQFANTGPRHDLDPPTLLPLSAPYTSQGDRPTAPAKALNQSAATVLPALISTGMVGQQIDCQAGVVAPEEEVAALLE